MAESSARKRRRRRSGGVAGRIGVILGTLLLIFVTTCAVLACYAAVYIKDVIMPQASLGDLTAMGLDLTSIIYYTDPDTGEEVELQSLHGDENRIWVSYDEIPEDLINATIAIEDKTFLTHHGVNWRRTFGAVLAMFTGDDIYGGSTITQQLIKNLTENDEVTVKRKVLEIFQALEFDKTHSKETTMEWYLNTIYLGERCNGVYTASYTYFGKHVSELTLAECAALIGITNNPSIYDPYLSLVMNGQTNRERNKYRQEVILNQMLEQGMISREEYDEAVAQELVFARGEGEERQETVYSWYVDEVISQVIEDLRNERGMSQDAATLLVYSGGLKIYTPYNPKVQAAVDQVYDDRSNLNYTSKTGQPMQSGITVVDNETGAVVALSGGIGGKTGSRTWNRATDTIRPPGSSIKPIAVYAPALELGLITPSSTVDDVPYQLEGSSPWPSNSYGYYRGLITVNEAVTVSSNAVAVRVLAQVTPQVAYDFLTEKLGITSLEPSRTEGNRVVSDIDLAPLALGGLTDGVSTYEMAAAFSAFPRGGEYIKPYVYTKVVQVKDESEVVLLENDPVSTVAMKESTAYYINEMLKSVVSSGTGTGARFSGMTIAGKTGTTTSKKDLWFVGYTPYYTAAVWTGYDQQERMNLSSNPSPVLWKQVMSLVHQGLENKGFSKPDNLVSGEYCLDSGMLPTEYCRSDARGSRVGSETYVRGDQPTQFCTLHVAAEICTESPILDENGNETGMYHLAGEFCPAECRKTVGVLNHQREGVGASVTARDNQYTLSWLEAQGTCTVHTQAQQPDPDDPLNPDDPDQPGGPDDPAVTPDPDDPEVTPGVSAPPETTTPGVEVPPSETPAQSGN